MPVFTRADIIHCISYIFKVQICNEKYTEEWIYPPMHQDLKQPSCYTKQSLWPFLKAYFHNILFHERIWYRNLYGTVCNMIVLLLFGLLMLHKLCLSCKWPTSVCCGYIYFVSVFCWDPRLHCSAVFLKEVYISFRTAAHSSKWLIEKGSRNRFSLFW